MSVWPRSPLYINSTYEGWSKSPVNVLIFIKLLTLLSFETNHLQSTLLQHIHTCSHRSSVSHCCAVSRGVKVFVWQPANWLKCRTLSNGQTLNFVSNWTSRLQKLTNCYRKCTETLPLQTRLSVSGVEDQKSRETGGRLITTTHHHTPHYSSSISCLGRILLQFHIHHILLIWYRVSYGCSQNIKLRWKGIDLRPMKT